jgi:SAM-dependent methyltransferase
MNHPTSNDLRKCYDEMPYPNIAKPFTHISRLAAIGTLRGLAPVSPARCRVLELGCADGGNLLPMALQFKESHFTGIDLSPVQIEMGRAVVDNLSLSNINLKATDIMDLGPSDLGRYDYIIVHGVYSWVSSPVRERILSICKEHLNEDGLAYISYNTYPGWFGKQALREMLQFHTRQMDNPRQKAEAAMELLSELPTLQEMPGDPATILAYRLQKDLEQMDDPLTYLVHEYLIDANEPLYFKDFLKRVHAVGLRYLDDAFPGSTSFERLPPHISGWIAENISDYTEQQQYLDFMANVSFRRSLLCHHHLTPTYEPSFNCIRTLYVNATCNRTESLNGVSRFKANSGKIISVNHAGLEAILDRVINARPCSVSVTQLLNILEKDITKAQMAGMFDGLHKNAAVEFTVYPFTCTQNVDERPYASKLVRSLALEGLLTNAAHRPVRLNDAFARHLLHLLDGTRSVPVLISLLQKKLTPDQPISGAEWNNLVKGHLGKLANLGLLAPCQETTSGKILENGFQLSDD